MTTQEFIERYDPCEEGREFLEGHSLKWAWKHAPPEFLIWAACQKGVLSESEQRFFAVWCARQVWDLLTDQRSRDAIIAAEAFARGEISAEKLAAAGAAARAAAGVAAKESAWAAAGEAAKESAGAAAGEAAWEAARESAWAAARVASQAAAGASARESAWAAAGEAAWEAARVAQAAYLRENCHPNFDL